MWGKAKDECPKIFDGQIPAEKKRRDGKPWHLPCFGREGRKKEKQFEVSMNLQLMQRGTSALASTGPPPPRLVSVCGAVK